MHKHTALKKANDPTFASVPVFHLIEAALPRHLGGHRLVTSVTNVQSFRFPVSLSLRIPEFNNEPSSDSWVDVLQWMANR